MCVQICNNIYRNKKYNIYYDFQQNGALFVTAEEWSEPANQKHEFNTYKQKISIN